MKTSKNTMILAMTLLLLTGCGNNAKTEITNTLPSDRAPAAETDGGTVHDAAGAVKDETPGGDDAAAAAGIEAERLTAEKAYAADDTGWEAAAVAETPGSAAQETDQSGEPFVLTAGEWNDNENWGFFANLVHSGTIAFPSYGLDPVGRVAVTVTHDGAAVQNQTVLLHAENAQIWEATTDQNGTAYLFYDTKRYAGKNLTVETAEAEPAEITVPDGRNAGQGSSSVPTLKVDLKTFADTHTYDMTQVMFILDTTGSMCDEISYLQKDFSAIAGELSNENIEFSVNFYRDAGDDYVTRCNPFTKDIGTVQKALNAEYAGGGGDAPEAVAEILDETMHSTEWQENTNKIAFLIFDAPPHSGSENERKICGAVEAAAAKGIRLVPVVASNADRDTELFGRALSVMTNSNYVFLTDDSGIGDSHLAPIIGDYETELLHDIIVRNIRQIAG